MVPGPILRSLLKRAVVSLSLVQHGKESRPPAPASCRKYNLSNRREEAIDQMRKILFVCEHNSARSQIAEAYLNHFAGDRLHAESAGLERGIINPYVIEVLREDDLDISANSTKSVFDLYKQQKQYDAVITVCSPGVSARCPIFPGRVKRWNWPFEDPSQFEGNREEILARTRVTRDTIKAKILSFILEYNQLGLKLFID